MRRFHEVGTTLAAGDLTAAAHAVVAACVFQGPNRGAITSQVQSTGRKPRTQSSKPKAPRQPFTIRASPFTIHQYGHNQIIRWR